MKRLFATKSTLLAAASVIAASAVVMPAAAADYAPTAPIEVAIDEMSVSASPVLDVDISDKAPLGAKKWALVMAAAGALAGLVKLIGARRVADAIASGTVKTAKVAAKAATSTAKAVGRTVSSPLRFLAILFGLALFALTGIGIFDIEWIGGLLSGAAMTAVGMFGVAKTRKIFQPIRVKSKKQSFSEMKN